MTYTKGESNFDKKQEKSFNILLLPLQTGLALGFL